MAGPVLLNQVRPESAVMLDDERWIAHARRRRALAAYEPQVQGEVDRLNARAARLRSKARRMPIGNGKRTALLDARRCDALAVVLTAALTGRPVQKHHVVGDDHERRAIRLLNELADVK